MTGELGKLKTHSPIYWMKDNCDNSLNLRHTLGSIYLTSILLVQCLQMSLHNDDNMRWSNLQTNEHDLQAIMHPIMIYKGYTKLAPRNSNWNVTEYYYWHFDWNILRQDLYVTGVYKFHFWNIYFMYRILRQHGTFWKLTFKFPHKSYK